MSKFHSGPNGSGPCGAIKGKCPFGGESGEENHFDTAEEAQSHFEKKNENRILATMSKSKKPKNVIKLSFSKEELKDITSRYPDSAVLKPGKYAVLEEGEGAQYSTNDYDETFNGSYHTSKEGELTDKSTDEELLEYSKKNKKTNYDTLRFIRDRMNRDTSNIETKVEGEYSHGYSMTQHYYNVEDLKKEYPGVVNSKNEVTLNNVVSFEVENDTPVINTSGPNNPMSLAEATISKEDEGYATDIRYRFYIGDPDSDKGGFLEARN